MKKLLFVMTLFCIASFAWAEGSQEQASYPTKPIKVIVPWGAGGGADISVRLLAKYAEEELGQKLVVSNVTGGSGTIGYTAIADAKNDGYTIGYLSSPDSNGDLLFEGISYTVDSFTPIIQYAADPHIIVASKNSGITSMDDLLKMAAENPEKITFGLGGAWTSHDFLRASLEDAADVKFKRMVFQGGAAAVNAVAGGNCMVAVPFVSEAIAQIEAGNVVPLAITSAERSSAVDSIPTVKEEGFDFTHTMWRGLVGPADMPLEDVKILSAAFEKAFNNPEYQKEAAAAGIFTNFMGSTDFSAFYLANHQHYRKLIEATK